MDVTKHRAASFEAFCDKVTGDYRERGIWKVHMKIRHLYGLKECFHNISPSNLSISIFNITSWVIFIYISHFFVGVLTDSL